MIAFAGASPFSLHHDSHPFTPPLPLTNHIIKLCCLKSSDPQLPAFDSDDDDDDDDSFGLEKSEDIHLHGDRRFPSRFPLSKAPKSKKSVKVVAKLSSSVSRKTKPSNFGDRERSSKQASHRFPDLELGSMLLTRLSSTRWEEQAYEIVRRQKLRRITAAKRQEEAADPAQRNIIGKKDDSISSILAGLELSPKCRAVIEYLISLGLDQLHLQRIAGKRKACFEVTVIKVRERLEYLLRLGVKAEDLRRIIVRHPQVLEYTVDRMMKPRIEFLKSIGVPEARLGRVITVAPSLLECSLERSLKPRVRFLLEEVGINRADLWKVVVLSPQVLTQSIEGSLRPRMEYFVKKLGASQERVAKMITKHPQLLHYSIEDGIKPRIEFLRSMGMSDPDIVKVLTRSSQILSLSLESSLKPKSDYLTKELKCGVQVVTSFPAYFSLSLEQRIRPRHEFLRTLNRCPQGSFPMHLLAVTDQEFCRRWANSTVEEYNSFRQEMQLCNFAKKFERKNRLQFEPR